MKISPKHDDGLSAAVQEAPNNRTASLGLAAMDLIYVYESEVDVAGKSVGELSDLGVAIAAGGTPVTAKTCA